jgi:hypothetical protein
MSSLIYEVSHDEMFHSFDANQIVPLKCRMLFMVSIKMSNSMSVRKLQGGSVFILPSWSQSLGVRCVLSLRSDLLCAW